MAKARAASAEEGPVDWHRLFGVLLADFFTDSPFEVETEKDLSLRQQRLDVVVIRKKPGTFAGRLPDGLDDLVDHNLVTFKSHREALDARALKELVGHYVNYRKQQTKRGEPLLAEERFRLYAVCARFPHNLDQAVPLAKLTEGVFECQWGTDRIRVIVANDVAEEARNAGLVVFSNSPPKLEFGWKNYRLRSPETSTILLRLFREYGVEGLAMTPKIVQEFHREELPKLLAELAEDEVVREMLPEILAKAAAIRHLRGLPAEERLRGLTPHQRVAGLTADELRELACELEAAEATAQKKTAKPARPSAKWKKT